MVWPRASRALRCDIDPEVGWEHHDAAAAQAFACFRRLSSANSVSPATARSAASRSCGDLQRKRLATPVRYDMGDVVAIDHHRRCAKPAEAARFERVQPFDKARCAIRLMGCTICNTSLRPAAPPASRRRAARWDCRGGGPWVAPIFGAPPKPVDPILVAVELLPARRSACAPMKRSQA